MHHAAMLAAQVFTARELFIRGAPADLRVAVRVLDGDLETLNSATTGHGWAVFPPPT